MRGSEFTDLNFLDFIVETYEKRKEKDHVQEINDNEIDAEYVKRGRKPNTHSRYLPSHPKYDTHFRIQRAEHHNNIPNIVGPWFPKRDDIHHDNDFYYASVLALLKPWRDLQSLKLTTHTWEEEFLNFLHQTSQQQRDTIAGLQYYYQSKSSADNRRQISDETEEEDVQDEIDYDIDVDDLSNPSQPNNPLVYFSLSDSFCNTYLFTSFFRYHQSLRKKIFNDLKSFKSVIVKQFMVI